MVSRFGDPIRLHSLCARLPQGGGGGKRIVKGGLFWNNIKEETGENFGREEGGMQMF